MPNYISVALLACIVSCGIIEAQQPERVSFCDLIKDPGKFDGRAVTLKASYRYGFEWQELFCVSCKGARAGLAEPRPHAGLQDLRHSA